MTRWLKLLFLFLTIPVYAQQLGLALKQINGQAIIDAGLTGNGIKVGIIDAGFLRAQKNESLKHLFKNGQILGYRDYLDPNAKPFEGNAGSDDTHGTEVLDLIAGYDTKQHIQYGLAREASFFLARTDHRNYESRQEEKYAFEAMEWMAEEGVQIINISLGYNFGYTDKKENYTPKQMDGKSTILTQAIERLSKTHNILFIVAAGNDGNKKWKVVGSPGDAESALTVGATNLRVWDEMSYSAKGPVWLNYVKPEISCYSSLGTSFSAPIITGLAACLLEKDPSLTAQELKSLILQSGNLLAPNNYLGYGVPDSGKALELATKHIVTRSEPILRKETYNIELEKPSSYITIYHKNGWRILKKEILRTSKINVKIKQRLNAESSTVIWDGNSIEVIWKD